MCTIFRYYILDGAYNCEYVYHSGGKLKYGSWWRKKAGGETYYGALILHLLLVWCLYYSIAGLSVTTVWCP